ncbi:MAG: DinB family protein [Thermoanaerobaculia bacterium]
MEQMTAYTTLLEEALEAWEYTRRGVIEEFQTFGEKELDYRPGEKSRMVLEIAQHIVESGLMMAGELAKTDGDFRRKSYEGFLHEHARGVSGKRSKAQLLALLRQSFSESEKRLRRVGELHMLQFINRFDGQKGTRLAWMNHGIAHEEYHRGQLALYARLLGRTPALTKRIKGA